MEKITTTTVYLEVDYDKRSPERSQEAFLIVDGYKSVGIYSGNNFWSDDNLIVPSHWLEKNEEMVCMSKTEAIKWAGEIWDASFQRSIESTIDHIIEIKNPAPDKVTFINNLFK